MIFKLGCKMNTIKPYFIPILCIGVFIICFYPGLKMLVHKWSISEDYAHAFFMVPIIIYMIWQKREVLTIHKPSVTGLMLVFFSIAGYLVSLQISVPAAMIVTTIASAIACLVYIGGLSIFKDLTIPLLLMILIIPIPLQLLVVITGKLQLLVSDVSADIIHLLSIPLYQEGNVLQLANKSFQVVDACSGIRSLISMTTLSLIISYFNLIRKRSMVLLFIFSIPVALIVNLARVVSMVAVFHYFKIDLVQGNPHTIAGLLLFCLGFILLLAFQRILERWER